MDNKRYLIFISSTFEDLKEEREKVIRAVLELNHFPVGMEQFPAVGIPPIELIKQVLKDCDYYILIIGARYGSINKESGISYTEEEYNYACSLGIPVIAFLPSDPNSFPISKLDKDNRNLKLQKLEDFKENVKNGGISIKYWNNADNLQSLVLASIPNAIKFQPRKGWVRADTKVSGMEKEDFDKLKEEIGILRTDNSQLQQEVSKLEETNKRVKDEYNKLEDELISLKASQTFGADNSSGTEDEGNEGADYWKEIHKVKANVRYSYDLLEKDFNYKVEYSLKEWFRMIGVIIKHEGAYVSMRIVAGSLGDRIIEDPKYNQLFNDRASKLIQEKKSSKLARVLFETNLKITSVTIDRDSINDVIKRLTAEEYLTWKQDYYLELTEKGEDFLLQHCL